jgi:signal transduction histidine kinase
MEFDPMKFSPRLRGRLLASLLAVSVLILAIVTWLAYTRNSSRGLPYRDSFTRGKADEWTAFGGTWELVHGMMRNDSDERGAKLLAGSPDWRNYSIEADVYLLGSAGDAGLIIRSKKEEDGVNAYNGYYAGVRTRDNSLVLGRAEHGWLEVTKQSPFPGGIRPFRWYHLKLLAFDCNIVASMTAPTQAGRTSIGILDQDCVRTGRAGLRSYSSGGIWRNVEVRPATDRDLADMLQGAGSQKESMPGNAVMPDTELPGLQRFAEPNQGEAGANTSTQTIASLRLSSFTQPVIATVRGVVILTTPRLYVQDSTGGIYIPQSKAPLLKVGDEVEVTGEVHPGDFSSTMDHATVQVLWARAPVPPVSVTASQASTGKYDATFIEVRGRLTGKERETDGSLLLDIEEGPQSFRAIMNPGRSEHLFSQLKLNSSLRLRGICVVDPALTHNLTPFILMLRSNEDLEIIAGPPWWSAGHVIAIVILSLLLTLVAVILYHRVENWRLRAVLEERGRLAHEMHDTLAQSFAGIGFQLQAIRNGLPEKIPALHQQLELASELVRHSHEEARRSIAALRSEDLESEDVFSALDHCARRMVDGNRVQVISEKVGDQRTIPLRIIDTLYRIGQEAIANAVRHATPTLLSIRLAYRENSICLQVEDNGRGFETGGSHLGFGIRGMRRRAQSISATFQLHSKPGEGTLVEVEAPLPPRVTLAAWPKLLWQYIMEHWIDARPARPANSHPYRG